MARGEGTTSLLRRRQSLSAILSRLSPCYVALPATRIFTPDVTLALFIGMATCPYHHGLPEQWRSFRQPDGSTSSGVGAAATPSSSRHHITYHVVIAYTVIKRVSRRYHVENVLTWRLLRHWSGCQTEHDMSLLSMVRRHGTVGQLSSSRRRIVLYALSWI